MLLNGVMNGGLLDDKIEVMIAPLFGGGVSFPEEIPEAFWRWHKKSWKSVKGHEKIGEERGNAQRSGFEPGKSAF
jgi:hypothetical protein